MACDEVQPGANASLRWSRLEPSAPLRRADNVIPTSLSVCKVQEATSGSQAVGEGPTHIPWPADTGEEAAAATALCIAAWGPGAGSRTRRPVRTLSPGAGPVCWDTARTRCWGWCSHRPGPARSPSSSSPTRTPPQQGSRPPGRGDRHPPGCDTPPATSQLAWADEGQSCPAETSGGSTSQQEGFGEGEHCGGPALPIPPCERRTSTKPG